MKDGRTKDPNAWMMLTLVCLVAFFMWGVLVFISPILEVVRSDLAISYAEIGIVFSAPIGILALLALPGGYLADRMGSEKTVGIGITILGASTILRGLSPNFTFLLIASALFGAGFGLTLPNLPKLISAYFQPRFVGTASGMYAASSLVGTGVVLTVTPSILLPLLGSWRSVGLFWGALVLAFAVAWGLQTRHRDTSSVLFLERTRVPPRLFSDLRVWLAGGLLFLENALFFSAVGWLPTFLEVKGFELASAASISALLPFFGTPAILVIGYLSDRTRSPKPILIGATGILIATSYLMMSAPSGLLPLLIAIMGVAVSSWFVICVILPTDIAPEGFVGTVAGIVFSTGYVGGLVGPWLLGYLLDLTGGTESGLLAWLAFATIGLALALAIPLGRRTNSRFSSSTT